MRSRNVGSAPDGGLSLVELVIGITVVAVVLAIAIPNLIASRMRSNEVVVVSLLRSVAVSQAKFRETALADEDFDGRGEFGTFGEMGGRVGVRGLSTRVSGDLTADLDAVDVAGEVQKHGYVFRIYLPRADGRGEREQPYGGMPAATVDPDAAERAWVCYTWPANSGISGEHTFVLSDAGRVLRAAEPRHSGQNCPHLRAGDAFVTEDLDSMSGDLAEGVNGSGGNRWELVD